MKRSDLKGKKVTVFGLGINEGGVGTVEFLERSGVREILVTDVKRREELAVSIKRLEKYRNITYVLGQHRPEDFTHTDLVIKNPAIPWTNEYVRLAEKSGVPVEMDSSLFFLFCKNPIIGVTGTKGKTSTASMIAHILESAGKPVARVGISQVPVLGALESVRSDDTVVFELSSWRLSALGRMKRSPHVAVFTNFYPDHLNYYRTLSAYRKDKDFIYRFQRKGDVLIASADLDIPDDGARSSQRWRFFAREEGAGNGAWFRGDEAIVAQDGTEKALFRKSDLRVPGEHVLGNALAAALVAYSCGISPEKIAAALRTFCGVPHRLELVAEKRGVAFYNDTAATIPEAAIAALRSFDRPVILIAGGADKQLSFGSFAEEILSRAKGAVFFKGNATDQLLRDLCRSVPDGKRLCDFETVSTMEKAVEIASRSADPGDVVLLSPGAASFGLFKNEFDRGEQFRKAVSALPGN